MVGNAEGQLTTGTETSLQGSDLFLLGAGALLVSLLGCFAFRRYKTTPRAGPMRETIVGIPMEVASSSTSQPLSSAWELNDAALQASKMAPRV